jgi:hypothetical protein
VRPVRTLELQRMHLERLPPHMHLKRLPRMHRERLPRMSLAIVVCTLVIGACGSAGAPAVSSLSTAPTATPTAPATSIPAPARTAGAGILLNWPEFGLNPQRSNVTGEPTGITAANVNGLIHERIALPGTVDSSPIYLHGVTIGGVARDIAVMSTTYGKTLAVDTHGGAILWVFTPPGYSQWAGSAQITTASPVADPDGMWVYAASPNGLIHKLSLATGQEDPSGGWPVSITRDPTHEKLGAWC